MIHKTFAKYEPGTWCKNHLVILLHVNKVKDLILFKATQSIVVHISFIAQTFSYNFRYIEEVKYIK